MFIIPLDYSEFYDNYECRCIVKFFTSPRVALLCFCVPTLYPPAHVHLPLHNICGAFSKSSVTCYFIFRYYFLFPLYQPIILIYSQKLSHSYLPVFFTSFFISFPLDLGVFNFTFLLFYN